MPAKVMDDAIIDIPEPAPVWIGKGRRKWLVHPFRYLVPEMPPDKYQKLVDYLRVRREPSAYIWLDNQNQVLDGRAQLRACIEVGIAPKFQRALNPDEPAHFIMGTMNRTPYSGAQANLVAASLMGRLEIEAHHRQVGGKAVKEKFPKGKSSDLAADLVPGSNGKWVGRARHMLAENPDVVRLIREGKIESMTHAINFDDASPAKRVSIAERLDAGDEENEVFPKPKEVDDLWLTPPKIIAAIKNAFGGEIALDPCSPEPKDGKSYVGATDSYTESQNGLDYDNSPWADKTFCNPPFSNQAPWILRALRAAHAGMRVYILLPVSPGSMYQQALTNKAVDVLYMRGRVPFLKPGGEAGGVGWKDIMIAGCGVSTRPLLEMGLAGSIVSTPPDQRKLLRIISEKEWILEDFPRDEEFEVSNDDFPEVTDKERADAIRSLREARERDEAMISAGREAVDVEAKLEDEAAAALKASKKTAQAKKKPVRA